MNLWRLLRIFGGVLLILSTAMFLPTALAAFLGEGGHFLTFFASALLTGFIGMTLFFATENSPHRLRRGDLLLLLAVLWSGTPVFAALPFAHEGFADAYFTAVSALTTTGLLLFPLDPVLKFWFALLQWMGGFAVISLLALLLVYMGIGGMSLRRGQRAMDLTGFLPALKRMSFLVMPPYLIFTALCICLLWATGSPFLDAVSLALSTISTGGMILDKPSLLTELVLTFFMLLGATSFLLHSTRSVKSYFLDLEFQFFLFLIAAATLLLWTHNILEGNMSLVSFCNSLFFSVSLFSTTGHSAPTHIHIPGIFMVLCALVGGMALSTAGGLKVMRLWLLLAQGYREAIHLSHPRSVVSARFGGRKVDISIMNAIWGVFLAMLISLAGLSVLLATEGLEFKTAFLIATAALSNTGPFLIEGKMLLLSGYSQLLLCAAMIAGRLEFLVLLGLLGHALWRG